MNNFALEIWDNDCSKCTFYTVRWIDAVVNETDKFFNKYYAIEKYRQSVQLLLSFIIDSIGGDHGAIDPLLIDLKTKSQDFQIKEKVGSEK